MRSSSITWLWEKAARERLPCRDGRGVTGGRNGSTGVAGEGKIGNELGKKIPAWRKKSHSLFSLLRGKKSAWESPKLFGFQLYREEKFMFLAMF